MTEKQIWIIMCSADSADAVQPWKAFRSKKQAEKRMKMLRRASDPKFTFMSVVPCGMVEKVPVDASSTP